MTSQPETFVELLRHRALTESRHTAYTFLTDTEETKLTYGELDERARAIAALLQDKEAYGDRVLLLYPPGLEFIAAFLGCLYAGAIAVPSYPPKLNRTSQKLQSVLVDAQARIVLTTTQVQQRIMALFEGVRGLHHLECLTTDHLDLPTAGKWSQPMVDGNTTALLQYTSGSAATPKGVIVTHSNLLHNQGMIKSAFQQTEKSVIVSWLPFYHDMGLIGGVLQPLYLGVPCILMSPVAFLKQPVRWLETISRYKATTSGGPNFAYDLCTRKITAEQRSALDLSSWRVAFNGAEPVNHETLERFAAAFASCGFQRTAFFPCYGLAESTLLVSGAKNGAQVTTISVDAPSLTEHRVIDSTGPAARTLVGCGVSSRGAKLVIVDPSSLKKCPSDTIGEIWTSSPSVTKGYWNRPEETQHTFNAKLANGDGDSYLRTGDLGFIHGGELFVTGRIKDLIIIRGLNHYPQDIEATVQKSNPALRPGRGAAFSVEVHGRECLVVVQEIEHRPPTLNTIFDDIRRAIVEDHELETYAIILIKAGSIPLTSSGKIQRPLCRNAYLNGTLEIVGQWHLEPAGVERDATVVDTSAALSVDEIKAFLVELVASSVGEDPHKINANVPIAHYGIDSLQAIEFAHVLQMKLNVTLDMGVFLQGCSITEIAEIARSAPGAREDSTAVATAIREGDEHSLSYGQRALWFLHQMDPELSAYHIVAAARVSGELDCGALRLALKFLINRHASLRATFTNKDGAPVQCIQQYKDLFFHKEDASDWSSSYLNEQLSHAVQRPFDLERDALLRVFLFRISERESVIALVMHHIIADSWSLAILMQELGIVYEAIRNSSRIRLSPQPRPYTDFVYWQETMLESHVGERQWAYWQERLKGNLPVLKLSISKPRPAVQSYKGGSIPFELSRELTTKLKAIGLAHGATLYMMLLAAFQILLYRYSGQEDILVGSPATGRRHAEWRGLVGYFVNPLVMRADLSGDPTFLMFLNQVRQIVLAALDHQDYPFPLLVRRLEPIRDAGVPPLFQAMFVLQQSQLKDQKNFGAFALNFDGAQLELAGLQLESMAINQPVSQVDLTLAMTEVEGRLLSSLQFNTDIFDVADMARLTDHFRNLLEGIAANPQHHISTLSLLTAFERKQLLYDWNDTATNYDVVSCLHQLVEMQAELTPDTLAVRFEVEELTYRELNQRANQLAHYLRGLGVRPESVIAVCMERSLEMVVALVGVLKAGGAYLPLDPSYPRARMREILDDADVSVVLTQERFVEVVPKRGDHVVSLDLQWETISLEKHHNIESGVGPDNLAYVIYTSGSSGKPKGVMTTHRSICNRLLWMQDTYELTQADRVLQKTPFNFDVSVWEFFWPLFTGARLVLARPGGHQDSFYLAELIKAQQITVLHFVPSMLSVFLETPGVENCRSRRRVICSGEALPYDLQERFFARMNAELHNLYGPTEAAVDVSFWKCVPDPDRRTVPIGNPIANTQLYILDRDLQPVPAGVAGELYIGGVGLARGYLNSPELTAEKFVPDSLGPKMGARLYRTGDMARHLRDGEIEFLGRVDHQVKIRGFRIELQEIESVILDHAAVREAVVIARADVAGGKQLVGYIVGDESDIDELRAFLRDRLPEYMIPSYFMQLEALPLMPNGKVDRSALPAPDRTVRTKQDVFIGPRNPFEEELCAIWSEVLGITQIHVYDNFFEIGGHSLQITRVITRIRETFRVEIPVQNFFQTPTVAGLAEVIESNVLEKVEGINGLLDQLEQLSDKEVEDLLVTSKSDPHRSNQPLNLIGTNLELLYEPQPVGRSFVAIDERFRCVDVETVPFGNSEERGYYRTSRPNNGCLSSYNQVIERIAQNTDVEPCLPPIATVGFVTADRAELLKRGLTSHIENNKRHGRVNDFVIMDDSRSVHVRNDYRQILRALKAQQKVEIFYAGLEEKLLYAKKLIDTGEVPPEIIKFGLFDTERTGLAPIGANRNALLLHTIGDLVVSGDDDTECKLARREMNTGIALIPGRRFNATHPCNVWTYPDREAVMQSLNFVDADFLATHEAVLGRQVGSLIAGSIGNVRIDLSETDDGFLRRLEDGGGRILVSANGMAGDCGWGSPTNYLFLTGASLKRLTSSDSEYLAACTRREIVRATDCLTITDHADNLMTTFIGLDNRQLVPPFIPVARGEDYVFGTMLSECLHSSYVAYLPSIILHTPAESRSFWPGEITRSASGISLATFIAILVKSHDFGPEAMHSEKKMRSLGNYLERIGMMSSRQFAEVSYLKVIHEIRTLIFHLEKQLELNGKATKRWEQDVQRFIVTARQSFIGPESAVPLDLLSGRSVDEARKLTQRLVLKFGQFLQWWPVLTEVARHLRQQGERPAAAVR